MNASSGARGRIAEAKAKAEKEKAVQQAIHERTFPYVQIEALEMAERSKEIKALAAKCLSLTKVKGGKNNDSRSISMGTRG